MCPDCTTTASTVTKIGRIGCGRPGGAVLGQELGLGLEFQVGGFGAVVEQGTAYRFWEDGPCGGGFEVGRATRSAGRTEPEEGLPDGGCAHPVVGSEGDRRPLREAAREVVGAATRQPDQTDARRPLVGPPWRQQVGNGLLDQADPLGLVVEVVQDRCQGDPVGLLFASGRRGPWRRPGRRSRGSGSSGADARSRTAAGPGRSGTGHAEPPPGGPSGRAGSGR